MSEEAVVVPAALDGERLDRAVCLLVGLSRSGASRLIKDGAVKIGEVPVTDRSHRLAAGELLSIDAERLDRTGAAPAASGPGRAGDVRFSVVYEDGDVIVVDKPSGLVTHPGAGNRDGTLAAGLLAAYPELADLPKAGYGTPERPGIVHRLDKETSGLLAIARSPAGFESLTAQLAARSMKRIYLALCSGHVAAASGLVDAPIGRSAREPTSMAIRADGRSARTRYAVCRRFEEPFAASELEIRLDTGRTHQIRVHLAAIGHPVVGDRRYGIAREAGPILARLPAARLMLHAKRLSFVLPASGDELELETSPPAGFVEVIEAFS